MEEFGWTREIKKIKLEDLRTYFSARNPWWLVNLLSKFPIHANLNSPLFLPIWRCKYEAKKKSARLYALENIRVIFFTTTLYMFHFFNIV